MSDHRVTRVISLSGESTLMSVEFSMGGGSKPYIKFVDDEGSLLEAVAALLVPGNHDECEGIGR